MLCSFSDGTSEGTVQHAFFRVKASLLDFSALARLTVQMAAKKNMKKLFRRDIPK
jgi:hypothetical protein